MAIWEKLFSKITFKDYPDTSTPLNATNLNKMTDAIDGIDDRVVELNSNLYNEDSYTVEIINNSNYTVAGNGIKEYARNGITTLVIGALKCTTPSSSWVHCGTLRSKPLSDLYFNLLTWEDAAPYKINCKIDTEGKVYFRYGVATTSGGDSINYYGTVTFS